MSTLLLSRLSVSGAQSDPAAPVITGDRRVFRQVFCEACRKTLRSHTHTLLRTQPAVTLPFPGSWCLENMQLETLEEYGPRAATRRRPL